MGIKGTKWGIENSDKTTVQKINKEIVEEIKKFKLPDETIKEFIETACNEEIAKRKKSIKPISNK
jgi:hypothetical protein